MTLVRLVKPWHWPDLWRQTPEHSARWNGITFTLEPVRECDYVVILNRVQSRTVVQCVPGRVWALIQEPPVKEYAWLQKGFAEFARVYTPDTSLKGRQYFHSHGALPWHVNRDYDDLRRAQPIDKHRLLSWVTSSSTSRAGHRRRMEFLAAIKEQFEFDLWGRGFRPLDDKWDGVAPYRYSLAIENHSGPYYWTEKLADCFLGWTMPIYYGCTNVTDFFPAESLVQIDINDPLVGKQIDEIIRSDLWLRSRDAIEQARNLVLDEYQLFPFIAREIEAVEHQSGAGVPEEIVLHGLRDRYPRRPMDALKWYAGKFGKWIRND